MKSEMKTKVEEMRRMEEVRRANEGLRRRNQEMREELGALTRLFQAEARSNPSILQETQVTNKYKSEHKQIFT